MKQILLACMLSLFVEGEGAQAQLLKKLKEKAAKALEKKPDETNNNASQQNNNGANEDAAPSNGKTRVKWQPTPDCEKLFTLGAGETFLYDETKVYAANGKISTAFIIVNKEYKYFLVEDGKRSGPFSEAPLKQMNIVSDKKNGDEDADTNEPEKISIGNDNRDPVAQQYCKTINNKLYIVFNGKNYGPYDYVAKMAVSPDKKKFWAVVTIGGQAEMLTKMGMGNTYLVNEGTLKQKTGEENSIPARLTVSQNFTAAAVSVMDNVSQKAFIVSSTAKKQESNMMDLYSNNGSIMTIADNGDIISVPAASPTQLLVNGNEAASFAVPVKNVSRLFILKDYAKTVYYQGGKLYRGDGSVEPLTGVTFPKFATLNGNPCIYYYKIHETDAGEKDVYLCNKCL